MVLCFGIRCVVPGITSPLDSKSVSQMRIGEVGQAADAIMNHHSEIQISGESDICMSRLDE